MIPQPLRTAKANLVLKGRSAREFAKFHGSSEGWVYQVLNGMVPVPQRFKTDLAEFLDTPVDALFPELEEAAS